MARNGVVRHFSNELQVENSLASEVRGGDWSHIYKDRGSEHRCYDCCPLRLKTPTSVAPLCSVIDVCVYLGEWVTSQWEQQMCSGVCHWGMKINLINLSLQTAFIHDCLTSLSLSLSFPSIPLHLRSFLHSFLAPRWCEGVSVFVCVCVEISHTSPSMT